MPTLVMMTSGQMNACGPNMSDSPPARQRASAAVTVMHSRASVLRPALSLIGAMKVIRAPPARVTASSSTIGRSSCR